MSKFNLKNLLTENKLVKLSLIMLIIELKENKIKKPKYKSTFKNLF